MKLRSFAVLLLAALGGCAAREAGVSYSPSAIIEMAPAARTILSCEQLSREEAVVAGAARAPDASAEQRSALEERLSALRGVAEAKDCRTS